MDQRVAKHLAHVVQPKHIVFVLESVVEQRGTGLETRHPPLMTGHIFDMSEVIEHHEQVHQYHGSEDDSDWAEETIGHPVYEPTKDCHPGRDTIHEERESYCLKGVE